VGRTRIENELQQQPRAQCEHPDLPPLAPEEDKNCAHPEFAHRQQPGHNLSHLYSEWLRGASLDTIAYTAQDCTHRNMIAKLGKEAQRAPHCALLIVPPDAAYQACVARIHRNQCPNEDAIRWLFSASPDQKAIGFNGAKGQSRYRAYGKQVAGVGMLERG